MQMSDFLMPECVWARVRATGKKQVLQILAKRAAETVLLNERDLLDTLLKREQLGSTGVGNGVAIPHGKSDKLENIVGFFAQLDQPVDFDAVDGEPVDLIFLLLAPETAGAQHLKALAMISRLMRNENMLDKLRGTTTPAALHALLISMDEPDSKPV